MPNPNQNPQGPQGAPEGAPQGGPRGGRAPQTPEELFAMLKDMDPEEVKEFILAVLQANMQQERGGRGGQGGAPRPQQGAPEDNADEE